MTFCNNLDSKMVYNSDYEHNPYHNKIISYDKVKTRKDEGIYEFTI